MLARKGLIIVFVFLVLGAFMPVWASGIPDQADRPGDVQEERPLGPDDPAADPHPESRPGEAEDRTALDVLSQHERTSIAFNLLGEEFADALDGGRRLAIFVPADEALEGIDPAALSDEEIRSLYERHITTGLASEEPIDYIDSFTTEDGRTITVVIDEIGTVVLNDVARVIDIIPVTNGIVYIIDATLD